MNPNLHADACDPDLLEIFLSGDSSDAEERELAGHLNTCESCRRALEQQAAAPEAWREAERLLTPAPFDCPSDDEASWGQTPQNRRQPLEIEAVLGTLAPTDDPQMLGRLGGYEVSGVVGSGGMGVVLKAIDRSLDRTVAIKVLSPHLAASGAARRRFAREAKAAAAVLHPNVIAIHSVSNDEALPYLVMPYLRGTSLQKRLEGEGPLALTEILRIGSQIAAGLAAAHAQGLVHRDIKPANILLEDGVERVAITDFGLARAVDDATLTRSGVVAGTPQYMSPEQARGEPLDGRSDLFSLGCVLYEMATGLSPFRADSTMATLRRVIDVSPAAIGSLKPELPAWFVDIVERLLEKEPAKRFGSAKEVGELLEGCIAHLQQPMHVPLPVGLPVRSPRQTWRSPLTHPRGKLVLIAALGIVALAVVLFAEVPARWFGAAAPQNDEVESDAARSPVPKGAHIGGKAGSGSTTDGKIAALDTAGAGTSFIDSGQADDDRTAADGPGARFEPTPEQRAAIQRGVAYLLRFQQDDGSFREPGINDAYTVGVSGLCTLALRRTGLPPDELHVAKALDYLRRGEPKLTYELAVQSLALCAAGTKDDLARIQKIVDLLEDSQIAEGPSAGGWTYSAEIPFPAGDSSNTEFAVWALDEAARNGARIRPRTWHDAGNYWRDRQSDDGGWPYSGPASDAATTGEMTCAGAVSLAICNTRLRGKGFAREGDDRQRLDRALQRLDAIFSSNQNPGNPRWFFCYAVALRRVAEVTNRKQFAGNDWHTLIAAELFRRQDQASGAFHETDRTRGLVDTSLALWFLGTAPEKLRKVPPAANERKSRDSAAAAPFEPFECTLVDERTGEPIAGDDFTIDVRFAIPRAEGRPWQLVGEVFLGPDHSGTFQFTVPDNVLEHPDRDMILVDWSIVHPRLDEAGGRERIRVNEILNDDPRTARETVRRIKLRPANLRKNERPEHFDEFLAKVFILQRMDAQKVGRDTLIEAYKQLLEKCREHPDRASAMFEIANAWQWNGPDFKADHDEEIDWLRTTCAAARAGTPLWFEARFRLCGAIWWTAPADAHKPLDEILENHPDPVQEVRAWYEKQNLAIQQKDDGEAERICRMLQGWMSQKERQPAAGWELGEFFVWIQSSASALINHWAQQWDVPLAKRKAKIDSLRNDYPFQHIQRICDGLANLGGDAPELAKALNAPPPQADDDAVVTVARRLQTADRVNCIACSADGKLIAIANGNLTFPPRDDWKRTVEVLDGETGETIVSLELSDEDEQAVLDKTEGLPHFEVTALAFSHDASMLAVGTGIGQVRLFDPRTGEVVRSLDDEEAKLAELTTPKLLKSLDRAMGGVAAIAFSPDGRLLAMSGSSFEDMARNWGGIERLGLLATGPGRLKVWEVETGALKHDLVGHSHVDAIAVSPDGTMLASAGRWSGPEHGTGAILWDLQSGAKLRTFPIESNGGAHAVAFSPNGKLLAIGARIFDKDDDTSKTTIRLVHSRTGIMEWAQTIPGWANPKAFSPDGKRIVVLCGGQAIRFLDTNTGGATQVDLSIHDMLDRPVQDEHEIPKADSQGAGWIDFAVAPKAGRLVLGGAAGERKGIIEIWELAKPAAAADSVPADRK